MTVKNDNNKVGRFALVTTHPLHTHYTLVKHTSETLVLLGFLVMSTIEWE